MADSVRITRVERHDGERPYVTANASVNGDTRTFDDRFGSWQTDRRPRADADWPRSVERRDALPHVAAALQKRAYGVRRGKR